MSRSIACGLPYGGQVERQRRSPEQVHRDRSGAGGGHAGGTGLSHSDPPAFAAATMPVKSSAAATGVPNRAPTVAAPAISTEICAGTFGSNRANRATMMPTLIAMIGFSGPRLTPPARLSTVTTARPGSTRSCSGGEIELGRRRVGPAVAGEVPQADAHREAR